MRRILGGLVMMVGFAGAAALTPFFAVLGAGFTFTLVTLGLSIWRSLRPRSTSPAVDRGRAAA
ncbi:MAG: hypothetical protein WCI61_01990 [Chloroflexota bacterium]